MSNERRHIAKAQEHTFRIRRRSCSSWMAWFLWGIVLFILLEYALSSFSEHEPQAGLLAGALFLGLLMAGLILEFVKIVESRSPYNNLAQSYDAQETENSEWPRIDDERA